MFSTPVRTVKDLGWGLSWVVGGVGLLVILAVGVAHTPPPASFDSPAEMREQAQTIDSVDQVDAAERCPALNRYATGGMTIDELQDRKNLLCPTLSDPRRTGN
jgi:hypothetical protein